MPYNSYQDRKQRMEDPLQPRRKENKIDKLPIGKLFVVILVIFVLYYSTSMVFDYELEFVESSFEWIYNDLLGRRGGEDLEL
ncbi:hypothetical protein [Marinococcus sp. PL1-022]|uniref:hypothetical protein n=1 Tax=Marinococcus sp. PL1-022 TaxID=3095363 RepID=UPI0029C5EFDA|nr:hypothetical protein [Marinococcus sp. PL1-022]MDX6154522.1 hypothetical protein [Marinococcus sp. PL1-022]